MSFTTRHAVTGLGALLLLASVMVRAQQPDGPAAVGQPVDFARDIKPIFEKHCAECHGKSKARARLRLHAPQFISKGGNSGAAIVPGDSHKSLLMRRVLDENEEDRMPLDADPLPEGTVALLRAWIDQG